MRLCKLSASEPLSSILLIPTFFLLSPPRPPPRSGAIVKRRPFFGPLMASRSQMAAFGGGPIRGVESKVLALLGLAWLGSARRAENRGEKRRPASVARDTRSIKHICLSCAARDARSCASYDAHWTPAEAASCARTSCCFVCATQSCSQRAREQIVCVRGRHARDLNGARRAQRFIRRRRRLRRKDHDVESLLNIHQLAM